MQIIETSQQSAGDKDRETTVLLDEPRRKLTLLTLRRGASISAHATPDPVIIECVAGNGTLTSDGRDVALIVGRRVALAANETHAVISQPFISLVLTRFTGDMPSSIGGARAPT